MNPTPAASGAKADVEALSDEKLVEMREGRGRHWYGEVVGFHCGCNMDVQELCDEIDRLKSALRALADMRGVLQKIVTQEPDQHAWSVSVARDALSRSPGL